MGRLLGTVVVALAIALSVVPAAGAASDPAALAAELPTPSCAEGPEREGEVIVGTPCADRIVVPATVTYVDGGAGDDAIVAAASSGATGAVPCATPPHCGVGSQEFVGGPGDDTVFGERGNDVLRGGAGNDHLFGGIGDDLLEGGPGNDVLSGGFGADSIDGGEGSDLVRGDATIDSIVDSGVAPGDVDTLSYATGATPGFGNTPPYTDVPAYPDFSTQHPGFPPTANGRGVYLDLGAPAHGNGFNGGAGNGGGADDVVGSEFERIIGSPFADYIVGAKAGQQIFGGDGGDVLISGGAGTQLFGGADSDDCVGEPTMSGCESTAPAGPASREEPTKVEVGEMAEGAPDVAELYAVGTESAAGDSIAVTTAGAAPSETVTFTRSGGAEFATPARGSGCALQPGGTAVVCTPGVPLDSVTVAGLGGDDTLAAPGLGETTSLVLLGGEGDDELTGGAVSDDTLVDGTGDDILHAGGGDDALVDGAGSDQLSGEAGNDLTIATVLCQGDRIDGGEGRDNVSWAKLATPVGVGVEARLDVHAAGQIGPGGRLECPGGTPDELVGIEDLEGSPRGDVLYGDAGPNQLLGHSGEDSYFAGAGEDSILANSNSRDAVIDCGADFDRAVVDLPAVGDPAPIECEQVDGAPPGRYETPPEFMPVPEATTPPVVPPPPVTVPPPTTSPPQVVAKPKPDRTPPQTKLLRRPAKVLRVRPHRAAAVVFRFAADERSSFECKLDAKPYRRCRSPLRARLRPGRHTFRVFATDTAGNRDKTPALVHFRVAVARHRR